MLDSFLYDPGAGTGTLVVGAAEGVFRFVMGKIQEMRSLITSVRPWTPTPRNRASVDPTDPGAGGNAAANDASYADNGFPRGTGAAAGGGKAICITYC